MSAAGSLVGFGLVFWALTHSLSLLTWGGRLAGRAWLRRRGAWAERQAAAVAIVAPPVLAAVVTVALAAHSLLGPALGAEDHCPGHEHHLHLCVRHAQAWVGQGWAVALVAGFTTLAVARTVGALAAHWNARRALRTLLRASRPAMAGERRVHLVPDSSPYCFTVGIRAPRIFVSSGAWDALTSEERAAVLAHEDAHVEQRDLWKRTILGLLALFSAPAVGSALLAAWGHATELICDRRAAERSSPVALAGALVAMARAGTGLRSGPLGALAFTSGCTVTERVEAVLADRPDGRRAAAWLGRGAVVSVAAVTAVVAGLADPLHHLAETLLGGH